MGMYRWLKVLGLDERDLVHIARGLVKEIVDGNISLPRKPQFDGDLASVFHKETQRRGYSNRRVFVMIEVIAGKPRVVDISESSADIDSKAAQKARDHGVYEPPSYKEGVKTWGSGDYQIIVQEQYVG
jgi:hypothetical protein